MKPTVKTVGISGGGPAGLTLASLLSMEGIKVTSSLRITGASRTETIAHLITARQFNSTSTPG